MSFQFDTKLMLCGKHLPPDSIYMVNVRSNKCIHPPQTSKASSNGRRVSHLQAILTRLTPNIYSLLPYSSALSRHCWNMNHQCNSLSIHGKNFHWMPSQHESDHSLLYSGLTMTKSHQAHDYPKGLLTTLTSDLPHQYRIGRGMSVPVNQLHSGRDFEIMFNALEKPIILSELESVIPSIAISPLANPS